MDNMNDMNENNIVEENITEEKNAENPKPWKQGWVKELIDWVVAIAVAAAVAIFLKTFVLTLAVVDGQSMDNTLAHGDRLYVNKLFYEPEKGDIVIIESDKHPRGPLVKRIIATEGDTIYIDPYTHEVYLNDKLLKEDYIKGETILPVTMEKGELKAIKYDNNDFPDIYADSNYSRENPIVVGKGEVFAMGDNRENSSDSRHMGLFKVEEVTGHAVFRFWPFSSIDMLD